VFTVRYALSPYIRQIRFIFKGLIIKEQILYICEMILQRKWRSRSTDRACNKARTLVTWPYSANSVILWNITDSESDVQIVANKEQPFVKAATAAIIQMISAQSLKNPHLIWNRVKYQVLKAKIFPCVCHEGVWRSAATAALNLGISWWWLIKGILWNYDLTEYPRYQFEKSWKFLKNLSVKYKAAMRIEEQVKSWLLSRTSFFGITANWRKCDSVTHIYTTCVRYVRRLHWTLPILKIYIQIKL
jgi:hypothetical protein